MSGKVAVCLVVAECEAVEFSMLVSTRDFNDRKVSGMGNARSNHAEILNTREINLVTTEASVKSMKCGF
jgi:hypothetical protein